MNIDIPKDQLSQIVSAAILNAITPENKEVLIKEAIAALIEPKKDSVYRHGPPRSALQDAFENAVRLIACDIVREELKVNEPLRGQIKRLVQDAMDRVMSADRYPSLVDRLAESIAVAMTHDPK